MIKLTEMTVGQTNVPKYKLNNGREMPAIALGTYLGHDKSGMVRSVNKQLRDVVMQAIDVGYRHFDTAEIYGTEEELGEGVRRKMEEGAVRREELFITDKLWNTHHKREQVVPSLRESLCKMGLSYIDLFLMHWPMGLHLRDWFPRERQEQTLDGICTRVLVVREIFFTCTRNTDVLQQVLMALRFRLQTAITSEDYTHSDVDFMETWLGLEDAVRLGLARNIGVSNFNKQQLERILREGSIRPAALQIEVHPQIIQTELVQLAQRHQLVVMGYSPFGSLVTRYGIKFPGPTIDDPTLVAIARRHHKTTPQVVLRWLVDRNVVPVTKTVNPSRLKENIDIFDFELSAREIEIINKFDEKTRYTLPSFWQTHAYYPFEKVDNPSADPFIKH
ncbi:3-dehydroecdysone 3beta-reductase [Danaus plexippus plexippus]|uniref:3-dehydroecdysone 3beta-reductase n=1 Tax=Danaus plexippus plexippus TaxID=278856 RepID=A0A212EPL8_DANPL|nr:3-dehydroecdysone 3beta-reductase [Danaus plexippus plexippus]